ncbi:hypothetical protein AB1Y20_001046 [Prymnesium parvum]|uniref:Uncharacterized protein n=1 Tax=Prymnesium parvum TaxID=97485 RepID=A0AB34KAI4_PRYPA
MASQNAGQSASACDGHGQPGMHDIGATSREPPGMSLHLYVRRREDMYEGLRQAWSQRLVEAADAAETRHAPQVDDDAVTSSSAEPESTTAPTAHATPQTHPPGWELALYALILLGVDVPGAGESTYDQLVMRLVFPEKELGLCGARISSGRQALMVWSLASQRTKMASSKLSVLFSFDLHTHKVVSTRHHLLPWQI